MSAKRTLPARSAKLVRGHVAALLLASAIVTAIATAVILPVAAAKPPSLPTDSQGYLNSPARCGGNQTAVVVGRTALSLVAICTDGSGHYEYRGIRLSDRAVLTLPAKSLANSCFGARTDAVDYTVSERKLLLTAGLRVLRDETMVEFKDYRIPTEATSEATRGVVSEAPSTQQAANQQFR
jgi:hypothetical protein